MENKISTIEFGQRIKTRRKYLGIKQIKLAEMLDISTNHLSSIETGKVKPSYDLLCNICRVLKVTPDYLMLGSMNSNNVNKDILDSLNLCSETDLEIIRQIINIFVLKDAKK
ncbi:MAG: helix-turn-helix domain-containing protein [Wujia sp.]